LNAAEDKSMAAKTPGQAGLENSYRLKTPEDNVAYYRGFAPTYDTEFAAGLGWDYPKAVAAAYRREAGPADVPVADIGCGTGFIAAELGAPALVVDGIDISPDMLAVAQTKQLYRTLHEVDLTGPLDAIASGYGAVLSAGTFTHGHLGPQALQGLLAIARPGGLFIIGVNQVHFEQQGFAAVLGAMTASGAIGAVRTGEILMYSKSGHEHSNDRALILHYRKT
jgi:predicted TPR repeat methyltransferase